MAIQNTYEHVLDQAQYISFDPKGTDWPQDVKDVQKALAGLGGWAQKDKGLPNATESVKGILRLATEQETIDGTLDNVAVSPKNLKKRLEHPEATESVLGLTRYATNTEATTGTAKNRSIVASSLKHVLDTRNATESVSGLSKLSTTIQATQGTDDTTAMTPKKVKAAISALTPSYGIATETNSGTVTLATVGIAQAGTAHDGMGISPKIFVQARASETKVGTTQFANQAQGLALSADNLAISAKVLGAIKGTVSQFGILKLTKTKSSTPNLALAGDADVVFLNGGNMTGRLKLNNEDYVIRSELMSATLPIGFYAMAAYNPQAMYGGMWLPADGRFLDPVTYKALFDLIGYTYGRSGNNFALPNFNDLFPRAASPSRPAGKKEEYAVPKGLTGKFPSWDHWRSHGWTTGAFKLTGRRWNTNVKNGGGDDWGNEVEYNPQFAGVKVDTELRPANMAAWFVIRVK